MLIFEHQEEIPLVTSQNNSGTNDSKNSYNTKKTIAVMAIIGAIVFTCIVGYNMQGVTKFGKKSRVVVKKEQTSHRKNMGIVLKDLIYNNADSMLELGQSQPRKSKGVSSKRNMHDEHRSRNKKQCKENVKEHCSQFSVRKTHRTCLKYYKIHYRCYRKRDGGTIFRKTEKIFIKTATRSCERSDQKEKRLRKVYTECLVKKISYRRCTSHRLLFLKALWGRRECFSDNFVRLVKKFLKSKESKLDFYTGITKKDTSYMKNTKKQKGGKTFYINPSHIPFDNLIYVNFLADDI